MKETGEFGYAENLGFVGFHWVFIGFSLGFHWVFTGFSYLLFFFSEVLVSFGEVRPFSIAGCGKSI